jgi:steroid delta-isomerase-like uncharacterized protein
MKNSVRIPVLFLMISVTMLVSGCVKKGIPADLQITLNQYIGYWNTGQFDGIEEVMAEDFELIESPEYEPKIGINYFKKLISNTRITYPDFKLEVNETVYEKDKIALIWTVTGSHKGPGEIPPTGRTIKGKGISVIHFENGKIKDEWLGNNNLLWLIQLGFTVVPPAAENTAENEP